MPFLYLRRFYRVINFGAEKSKEKKVEDGFTIRKNRSSHLVSSRDEPRI